MQTLLITPETTGWQERIQAHLAAGDSVTVKIETPWLSPAQVVESLNVSRSAVQKWIEQGKLLTERHGTYHHIPAREIERFRAERIHGIAHTNLDVTLEDMRHS